MGGKWHERTAVWEPAPSAFLISLLQLPEHKSLWLSTAEGLVCLGPPLTYEIWVAGGLKLLTLPLQIWPLQFFPVRTGLSCLCQRWNNFCEMVVFEPNSPSQLPRVEVDSKYLQFLFMGGFVYSSLNYLPHSKETLWRAAFYPCICVRVSVQAFIFERWLFTEQKGKSQVLLFTFSCFEDQI